uniref:Uncharacterized protein n=1 Tax=Anguilla anguilla TaxID=7936 RepID=A0A0E9WX74_ANGAN
MDSLFLVPVCFSFLCSICIKFPVSGVLCKIKDEVITINVVLATTGETDCKHLQHLLNQEKQQVSSKKLQKCSRLINSSINLIIHTFIIKLLLIIMINILIITIACSR